MRSAPTEREPPRMSSPAITPTLPEVPAGTAQAGFPLLASLAPIIMSVAIFAITKSPFALLFAFLGPVIAIATFTDGAIRRRRDLRRQGRTFDADVTIAAARIAAWHDLERAARERAHPFLRTVVATVERDTGRWPPLDGRVLVALGRGAVNSDLVLDSGRKSRLSESSPFDDRLDRLADSAGSLDDAPIVVDASSGIAVCGRTPDCAAIARALVVQLTRILSPRDVEIRMSSELGWQWVESLPHRVSPRETEQPAEVLRIDFVPADGDARGRILASIVMVTEERLSPRGFTVVSRPGSDADRRERIVSDGLDIRAVTPDYCTVAQASAYAAALSDVARRERVVKPSSALPSRVEFAEVAEFVDESPERSCAQIDASSATLACSLGKSDVGVWSVDLVRDGPHAVIGGTTGSGKSELLVTWVLALAARYSPTEVSVLLVDFKGGSAFSQIADVKHTVGVLSDLDARSAKRALESLSAEIRFRERHLLENSVRSIEQLPAGSRMPRLVVFVDEFAALARDLPDLREVFVDLAARGRSLGVHLVLCTQRPADVMRDAILANVTLRISLRVNDRPSSVALLGSGIAAELPRNARGRAAVSIAGEEAHLVQVAIAGENDVQRVSSRWASSARARRPWCDPLPADLRPDHPLLVHGGFGLADLPAEQSQRAVEWMPERDGHLLVEGARRSGRSTALAALAASLPTSDTVVIPTGGGTDVEACWDTVADEVTQLERGSRSRPRLVMIDDVDVLSSKFGADHQTAFIDLVARLMRDGPAHGLTVALSTQKSSSSLAPLLSQCDSRLLLRMPTRHEHLLAQGRPDDFDERMSAGGGWWRGDRIQVVMVEPTTSAHHRSTARNDDLQVIGGPMIVVTTSPTRVRESLARSHRIIDLRDTVALRSEATMIEAEALVPRAIIGDVDAWHGSGAALARLRGEVPVIVHGYSPAEFRAVTRSKEYPPPLAQTDGRAWVYNETGAVGRATLP